MVVNVWKYVTGVGRFQALWTLGAKRTSGSFRHYKCKRVKHSVYLVKQKQTTAQYEKWVLGWSTVLVWRISVIMSVYLTSFVSSSGLSFWGWFYFFLFVLCCVFQNHVIVIILCNALMWEMLFLFQQTQRSVTRTFRKSFCNVDYAWTLCA